MQTPNAIPIAGLILAGGRGERLGGAIKSELVVGGRRLLDRVRERLAGCAPILVAHGRLQPEVLKLPADMVPVADLAGDYAGPLAGFAAAMAWCAERPHAPEFLLTAAVDAPFLPADYAKQLTAAIGDADVAMASYGGQPYPTNAIWRVARFIDLPGQVAAGTAPRSLKRLAAGAAMVDVAWPDSPAGDPFTNINTPEELAAARHRAGDSA